MRYIEYQMHELDNTDIGAKSKIELATQYGVSCISVPFSYTKLCRAVLKDKGSVVVTANPIDYPCGILDTQSRNECIINAIKNGAQKINIVIQNHYLANKKYDKIRQDIISNYNICNDNNVVIDYYLEYRVFTHQALMKACSILLENDIKNVYMSTGYFVDNPEDNLIATILLQEKTKINTIFTGNIWTEQQVNNLNKNKISSISMNTIQGLKLVSQHYHV